MNIHFSGISLLPIKKDDFKGKDSMQVIQELQKKFNTNVTSKSPMWLYTFDPQNGDHVFLTGKDAQNVYGKIVEDDDQLDPAFLKEITDPDSELFKEYTNWDKEKGFEFARKYGKKFQDLFLRLLPHYHTIQQYYVDRKKAGTDIAGKSLQHI